MNLRRDVLGEIDDSELEKNCNLVGTLGLSVQVILVFLIFTAVKCRPVSTE